jgi:hypothetical protein
MNAMAPGMPIKIAASLFALLFAASWSVAGAATKSTQAPAAAASGDFGSPPSGEVPILFNDHTVYAKPDVLKEGRVLAALVKDGQIFVPLRSMLEEMGATVSASADGNTITALKSGVSVSVTVGKNEVVINGESRPLDVAPMLYKGIVLVPVRVLSEALGAYVQWVPDQHVVVVRYIVPTPEPTAEPTAAPTAPPTPTVTPVPVQTPYPAFIQAGFVTWPKNYNEFTAGAYCKSYVLSGGWAIKNTQFAVKVDYRYDSYLTSDNLTTANGNQYTRFSTIDGGTALTPVFLGAQTSLDVRLEYKILNPWVYVGVGYLHASNNYGYPQLNGAGFGIEKLPNMRSGVNFYGSAFYYPNAGGSYTVPGSSSPNAGNVYQQQYGILKYDVGVAVLLSRFPLYLDGGFSGDQYAAKKNAPIGQTHVGPYIGLGVKI